MKYKIGLVIGRFQPFHLGHKYLIEKALTISDKIVVGIGSPNVSDEKNPYDLSTRKKFLAEFIKRANIEDKVLKIVSIPDVPDDNEWLSIANKKTGKVDVVIGDNEWVNGIYEASGIPVARVGHFKRKTLEGTKIRHHIKTKKPWKSRVPVYLVPHIEKKGK